MRLLRRESSRDLLRTVGWSVGVFLAVSLVGEVVRGPFETFGDWVSWPASRGWRLALAVVVACALFGNGPGRARTSMFRRFAALVFGGVAWVACRDVLGFAAVVSRGAVQTPVWIPASVLVAGLFAALAHEVLFGGPSCVARAGRGRTLPRLAACAAIALALPLVRMATFGQARYERPADVAVVFGARVWNTGSPSLALSDRVDEAVRLYHRGLVGHLLMSGAIDEGNGFSEPVVMRDRAEALGVPREAIILDEDGVDTASTVRNAARFMREEGLSRALVVTHYYHEPRAKLLFDRAGITAYTVPATMSRRLAKEPYFLAREVLAYYHTFLLE